MKTLRHHRTVLFLALLFSAAVFYFSIEKGVVQEVRSTPALLPLRPDTQDRNVAQAFVIRLEQNHISQRALDPAVSQEAFRLYLKTLDPRKMFFYQEDIDEFRAKYEQKLCELLKPRQVGLQTAPVDLQPAFEIYNRYLDRLKQRVEMVQHILNVPMDFTLDEEYAYDKARDFTFDENVIRAKGLQSFPRTTEEAYERWRKRIKSELLALKADAANSEKKREKAIAEGKEPPEIDQRDPIERVRKRYISLQRQMRLEGHIDNAEIFDNVRRQANDEVMEKFLDSIAGALDPHSSYMSPSTKRTFDDMMKKNFDGIGATLSSEDGFTVVRGLVKGGPAERSKELQVNDRIRGVGEGKDGKIEEVIDFKTTDVVKLIRGNKGTVVRLEVLPGGKGPPKIVELVRETVTLDSQAVQSEIFEAGTKADGTPYKIGFIDIPDFYLDTDAVRRGVPNHKSVTSDTRKKLREFVENNVDAVVIDLRYNGGGVLHEAIEMAGLFLGPGVVVQVKDDTRPRPIPRENPATTPTEWTGPLVVITNKFSASASEIFSGAIKDYGRGLLVGDSTTLGKGTVQQVIEMSPPMMMGLSDYGSAKVTIQGFYRPNGVTTQGIGVPVDIVLPSRSDVMEGFREADLDNMLSLAKVVAAPFTPRPFVTSQIIADLKKRSDARIRESEEFAQLFDKINALKENQVKRATTLNEAKYMEEEKRAKADEADDEELEDLLNRDKKIKRDFYVDEVLAITVDYMKIAQETGMAFPRERTAQPRQQRFGLFGF